MEFMHDLNKSLTASPNIWIESDSYYACVLFQSVIIICIKVNKSLIGENTFQKGMQMLIIGGNFIVYKPNYNY